MSEAEQPSDKPAVSEAIDSFLGSSALGRRLMRSLTKETMLLAIAGLLANLFVFVHEWGFCSRFGIPLDLVSFNLTEVLIVAATIVGVLNIGAFNFYFERIALISLSDEEFKAVRGRLSLLLFLTLLAVPFLSYLVIFVANVLWFWLMIYRFIKMRRKNPPTPGSPEMPPFEHRYTKWLGRRAFTALVVTLYLLLALYYYNGWTLQKGTLVSTASPQYALLRTYGDTAVLAPLHQHMSRSELDSATTIDVDHSLRFIHLGSEPPMGFELAPKASVSVYSDYIPHGFWQWFQFFVFRQ